MNAANALLDGLSALPYFRGKGTLALLLLRAAPSNSLTARLPNNGRMWLGLEPLRQSVLPYWIGKYEPEVIREFRTALAQLPPNAAVFDIGANVGFYTVLAAAALRARGNGTVHSFEPNPMIFAELERNVALNQFTNVQLCQQGVSDVVTEMPLFVNDNAITFSSLRRTQDFLTNEIRVPVTTLDAYTENFVAPIGLIKIDVEGGELAVLRGARKLLQEHRPIILYEEFERGYQQFGYTIQDTRAYLRDFGYELLAIDSHTTRALDALTKHVAYQNVLARPLK